MGRIKIKHIAKRLSDIETALLLLSNNEPFKCAECFRKRYAAEFHRDQLKSSVKNKVCKICVNKKRREAMSH